MQDNDVVTKLVEQLSDGDTYFEIATRDEMVNRVKSELASFLANEYNVTVKSSLLSSPKVLAYLESEVPEGDYDAIDEDEYDEPEVEYSNSTERILLARETGNPEVLAELAHDDLAIVRAAAANRVTDPLVIKELANDPDEYVREQLVFNPAISRNIMKKLASDPNMFVRNQVANYTDDVEILEQLAQDEEGYVSEHAADRIDHIHNS